MADEGGIVARWRTILAAVADPGLHRSDIAVLAVILDRMNGSGVAWPSMSTISADAKVSRGQVIKVLPKLRDRGYLVIESGSKVASNRYRIGSAGGRLQEPTGRRAQEPTGGRLQEPGVDACSATGVDAPRRPEPALKATSSKEPGTRTRSRAPLLTFNRWFKSIGEDPRKAVPTDDPIFEFAAQAGISDDHMYLAWRWFENRYQDDDKQYRDWRSVFRRAVREDWHRCWRTNRATGEIELTEAGLRLQHVIDAEEREAA